MTGALTSTDTSLACAGTDANSAANPEVHHVAYTNSVTRALTSPLFGIDVALDILVSHGSNPNQGTLTKFGSIGVNATNLGGFDIDGLLLPVNFGD